MPFGLSGAPTFQHLMQSSVNDLVLRIILVYLDDVLVFSSGFDDHIMRLETVFNCLKELGLKLNPEKCQFGENIPGPNSTSDTIKCKGRIGVGRQYGGWRGEESACTR
ncbi:retrovirus-related pol polyprotein from transposon 17.6 [Plakobranchus ocellatus]|uniref:Retrovirus-related pol polyprotein from transposon 17.6 n=1 Tax=Plakobranchus ocellatus TaxID=259542 RepID=A0AAV3Y6E5_9GAST|nr:retrovirus-related pol polyprotein from transposon 17.6 [Plakobranchus ocellatus]